MPSSYINFLLLEGYLELTISLGPLRKKKKKKVTCTFNQKENLSGYRPSLKAGKKKMRKFDDFLLLSLRHTGTSLRYSTITKLLFTYCNYITHSIKFPFLF